MSWVAVPSHLPISDAPDYGYRALRSTYRGALTRGVACGALGLLLLVTSTALWLDATRRSDPVAPSFPTIIIRPGPTSPPLEMVSEIHSTGPASLLPELRRFLGQKITPSLDLNARVDTSLARLSLEQFAVGLYTDIGGIGDGLLPIANSVETAIPADATFQEPAVALSMVQELPILVTLPRPLYPQLARDAGIEGVVELNLLINARGTVEQARILRSVPALDEAAREAALRARFRPARWQERPVRVWATLKVHFRLKEF